MRRPTESDLVRQCLEYLALRGVFAWRNNTAGIRRRDRAGREFWAFAGCKGVADILGVLRGGQLLAVEGKTGRNRPTPDQEAFLAAIVAAGGLAVVAYRLEDLVRALG